MEQQKRILGIDYGSRRIGIAISDPLQIIAQSLETIENDKTFIESLKEIIQRERVELVVVGMPLNLKGEKARKAQEVEQFIAFLKKEVAVDVLTWDERFTSSIAQASLLQMGTKKKQRREGKERIDAMAAAIMLQGFLDSRKKSLSC